MLDKCPGSEMQLTIAECPHCKEEVEFFTGDVKVKCDGCGQKVYREGMSCIEWCPKANECFGSVYEDFVKAKEAAEKEKASA